MATRAWPPSPAGASAPPRPQSPSASTAAPAPLSMSSPQRPPPPAVAAVSRAPTSASSPPGSPSTRPPAPASPSTARPPPPRVPDTHEAASPSRPPPPARPVQASAPADAESPVTPGKIALPPPRARQVPNATAAVSREAPKAGAVNDNGEYPRVRGFEVKTDAFTKDKIVLYRIDFRGQTVFRRLAEAREFHVKITKMLAKMNAGDPPAFPAVNVGVFGSMDQAVYDLDAYFHALMSLPEEVVYSPAVEDFFRPTPKDLQEREAGALKAARRSEPAAVLGVAVTDCKKIREPSEKYYAYALEVSHGDGSTVTVWRRYREFFDFVARLKEIYPSEAEGLDAALPPRVFFGRSQVKDVADKRVPELNKFMQYVMTNELTSDCQQLRYFLHPTFNAIAPPSS